MSVSFRPMLAVVAVASAVLLVGCGSTVQGTPVAQSGIVPATGSAPRTTGPMPTGIDEGGDLDVDVQIGECVEVGGTTEEATIDNAVCGSPESNYKVVAKVPSSDLCGSDIDQYYYEERRGVEQGALCLDIDYVVGGCMDVGTPSPVRIECDDNSIDGIRVVDILTGTTDVDLCLPTPYGFVYDEREFVVCYDEL